MLKFLRGLRNIYICESLVGLQDYKCGWDTNMPLISSTIQLETLDTVSPSTFIFHHLRGDRKCHGINDATNHGSIKRTVDNFDHEYDGYDECKN